MLETSTNISNLSLFIGENTQYRSLYSFSIILAISFTFSLYLNINSLFNLIDKQCS